MQNRNFRPVLWALGLALLSGCGGFSPADSTVLNLHQKWQLQPGDRIAGHRVTSGLGDIGIELGGAWLQMPAVGKLQPVETNPERVTGTSAGANTATNTATKTATKTATTCAVFSSPEIPGYQVRLCGLRQVHWGAQKQGDRIGRGDRVSIAMLRKQPDGAWAMVEPATKLLEQFFIP